MKNPIEMPLPDKTLVVMVNGMNSILFLRAKRFLCRRQAAAISDDEEALRETYTNMGIMILPTNVTGSCR